MRYPKLTKEFIENHQQQGLFQHEIAQLIGCTRFVVMRRAKEHGISFAKKRLKYEVNDDFFNKWSYDMAYILGFIMADGCIFKRKKCNSFALKTEVNMKDIEVLEFIRDKISPSRPIRKNLIHKNKDGKISLAAEITITLSKQAFDRLGNLGIVPRKSGKEYIPTMSKKYLWTFICGLFDGDGSVYKRKGPDAGGFDWYICSSSRKLMLQLLTLIPNGKINTLIRKDCKDMYTVSIRDKKGIRDIRKKLYENTPFCLTRKHNIMKQV